MGGRKTWMKPQDDEKYKQYINVEIKFNCDASDILNHSSPSGRVLWGGKVKHQVTFCIHTFHHTNVHVQLDAHEDKSTFVQT